jgi:hypothetical protein
LGEPKIASKCEELAADVYAASVIPDGFKEEGRFMRKQRRLCLIEQALFIQPFQQE